MKRLQYRYSVEELRQMWQFTEGVRDAYAYNVRPGRFERFLDLLQWLDGLDRPSRTDQLESLRILYQSPKPLSPTDPAAPIAGTVNRPSPDPQKEPEGSK